MSDRQYTPPPVWQWNKNNGGAFANINRPVAGSTHDGDLPIGKHPWQLYSLATPNGMKVTIMLEELLQLGFADAEYDAWLIDIGKGDQFGSHFVSLNPNSKIPVLLDCSVEPARPVFESCAILHYLARRFDAFIPQDEEGYSACLSWLFWQESSSSYLGGGFGHFYRYAPYPMEYPINRYTLETKRQLDVLNRHLSERDYIVGDDYSIADIAIWAWYGQLALGHVYDAVEFLDAKSYSNVISWAKNIAERTAVRRGRVVNRTFGNQARHLPERHTAQDIDTVLAADP